MLDNISERVHSCTLLQYFLLDLPTTNLSNTSFATKSFDFPKAKRIITRNEFLLLKNEGKKKKARAFLLVYIPYYSVVSNNVPSETETPVNLVRLGITVSKKVSKKAVVRNKIKRRIREVFRNFAFDKNLNLDIQIIAYTQIIEYPFLELKKEIEEVFCSLQKSILRDA